MSERGEGRPRWGMASRRGWRRGIRRMMANITPKNISKLEALRQSDDGHERLRAGQRFGRIETVVSSSGAETSNERNTNTSPHGSGRE